MSRDPRAIHEAEQLGPWLRDMAGCLAVYRDTLRERKFSEQEVREMVFRMECELFGYTVCAVCFNEMNETGEGWTFTPEQ